MGISEKGPLSTQLPLFTTGHPPGNFERSSTGAHDSNGRNNEFNGKYHAVPKHVPVADGSE